MGLKTACTWCLEERLRNIFSKAASRETAETMLDERHVWARHYRLEPFKKLAWRLRAHWQGLLNGFVSQLSKGSVERITP